ncbi:MAG TPA: NCS2 family permease [Mycobacteriales bacterium]|nr:NCS2 family permease [Mycobacteriales bacterium]
MTSTAQGTAAPAALDRYFKLSERGTTVTREVRGGFATFFTMAYIVVLNPIILAGAKDKYGHTLSVPQLAASTALAAAVMTAVMGLAGNLPLAIAAGLGLNGVVAFTLAPTMSWPDAMGLVVIEGLLICVLVATGLRTAIFGAIPLPLKRAISVGIGLFIAFIGLVDSGFVTPAQGTPVQLGTAGTLKGWPVFVFCVGLLLTVVLVVRQIKGAILIGIVSTTVLAVILHASGVKDGWGLITPKKPDKIADTPDLHLLGKFSLHGGFQQAGIITAIVFVFTLVLSDFFDAMGTITGISAEAGLLNENGEVPKIGTVLFVDGLAAVAGGAASSSSNTAFIESAAGVGEGARTGLANLVTSALFVLALFLTPLYEVVPQQAAAPALVVVGFLMLVQVKDIPWDDWEISVPAFLTIVLMPFTYSITNGIGAGLISFVLIKAARGKAAAVNILVWIISALFLVYFLLDPIEQVLNAGPYR